jgi:hypothetical protein
MWEAGIWEERKCRSWLAVHWCVLEVVAVYRRSSTVFEPSIVRGREVHSGNLSKHDPHQAAQTSRNAQNLLHSFLPRSQHQKSREKLQCREKIERNILCRICAQGNQHKMSTMRDNGSDPTPSVRSVARVKALSHTIRVVCLVVSAPTGPFST